MTPEEIEKQKADKIEKAPVIQSDKAVIETPSTPSTELGKSQPVVPTPAPTEPVKLSRRERMAVQDKGTLRSEAAKSNIDIDNLGKTESTPYSNNKLKEAILSAHGKDIANKFVGIADSLTPPPDLIKSKLDQKALLDSEKRERRAKFGDALYAFGEGMQGRTADHENFASTRIQRARDKEFQDYKNATDKNKQTRWAWESQNTTKWMDWADEQAKNGTLDAKNAATLAELKAKATQDQANKDRSFKQTGDHYKAMENKKSGSGKLDKDQQNIKVSTDQKTYDLKPEEASLMYGKAVGNSDVQKLHPEWFDPIAETELKDDGFGDMKKTPTGKFTYKPKAGVDKTALIRAHLELTEKSKSGVAPQPQSNVAPQNSASYFDKYRKEKGLSTAPVSETTKASPKTQAQPKTTTAATKPSLFQ